MQNIEEISENTYALIQIITAIVNSAAQRLVGSKWNRGISRELAGKILQEFSLFSRWVVERQLDQSQLEKKDQVWIRSGLKNYLLIEDNIKFYRNRKLLYESYCSDEIISHIVTCPQ